MKTKRLTQVAMLVTMASALHWIEEVYLPPIIPFLRIGLANILTLIAIVLFGLKEAVMVSVLRCIIGGMLNGRLFGPTSLLSLSGAITAAIVMAELYKIKWLNSGLVGVSIIGAIFNNIAQLIVVYLILIPHVGVLTLTPLLLISGLITGFFNGVVATHLLKSLEGSGIYMNLRFR